MELQKTVQISVVEQQNLSENEQVLLNRVEEAIETSYAPYSEFHVGCSVELSNGDIVLGSNQENASFPSGLCAERVALFEVAKNLKQHQVLRICIDAKSTKYKVPKMLVPCAACLQVISDIEKRQGKEIEILMKREEGGLYKADGVHQFLPFHFELKS